MNNHELEQLFRVNSNCYADTGEDGPLLMAMTEDVFLECVTKIILEACDKSVSEERNRIYNDLNSLKKQVDDTSGARTLLKQVIPLMFPEKINKKSVNT